MQFLVRALHLFDTYHVLLVTDILPGPFFLHTPIHAHRPLDVIEHAYSEILCGLW